MESSSSSHATDLRGARCLLLRGSVWGEQLARDIRFRGGATRLVPILETHFSRGASVRRAMHAWSRCEYDWLVLTSQNAVRAIQHSFAETFHAAALAAVLASRSAPRVAAVGPATERAATQIGLRVVLTPKQIFSAAGLCDALLGEPNQQPARFLVLSSSVSAGFLTRQLLDAGHVVHHTVAYETREVSAPVGSIHRITAFQPNLTLITSPSAAHAFSNQLSEMHGRVTLASIGQSSTATLTGLGLSADVTATQQTSSGLLDAIANYLSSRNEMR